MTEKGIYCLILKTGGAALPVGALGEITFPAGWYIYVGSALGTEGLARVQRHIRVHQRQADHRPRWHIDRLLTDSRFLLTTAVCGETTDRLECTLAHLLGEQGVRGFGCSDCRCITHLLHRDEEPQAECCRALNDCGCKPVVIPVPFQNKQSYS
jgi:Uri superfamily endonuclease